MSATHPDQVQVSIYGMRDSREHDDVARASRKATTLGATVVSRLEAPQLEAVFSDIIPASDFAIWLSTHPLDYHTYTLTQVQDRSQIAWPRRNAARVKANCVALAANYNAYARRYRITELPEEYTLLVAAAINRTPLLELTQETEP